MLGWLLKERIATSVTVSTETGEIVEWNARPWSKWLHDEAVSVDATRCYVMTENDLATAVQMARDAIFRFKCLQPTAVKAAS